MKTTWVIPVLLVLLAAGAQAAVSKVEIHDLIVRGEKGAAQCNKTFDRIRALDKNFDYGRTFPNKKASMKVIQILSKFPGTPAPTKELMNDLMDVKTKSLDIAWLSKEMNRTLVCDPMALNLVLTKLVRSSRKFRFTPRERHSMARVILRQLRKEAEFPTHLGLLAPYILILDALVDENAIRLSEAAAAKRVELKAALNSGLAELKERDGELRRKVNDKQFQTLNFLNEVRENEPFRVKFLEFMDTL
jgi:hypothetical protein